MRDNSRMLVWAFIFVALISAAAVVIAAVISNPNRQPQLTPATQQVVQPTAEISSVSTVYDDFNDPSYDGKYNAELWSLDGGSSTVQVYQQNGMLVLSDIADISDTNGGVLLRLRKWEQLHFDLFRAKVMLSDEREGNSGNITLDAIPFSAYDIPGGWAEFGMGHQNGGVPNIHAKFGNGQGYKETVGQYNTWFTLRIEFDKATDTFSYFIDNDLLTTMSLPKTGTDIKFQPVLQLWHPKGSSIKAFVDDVVVSLNK